MTVARLHNILLWVIGAAIAAAGSACQATAANATPETQLVIETVAPKPTWQATLTPTPTRPVEQLHPEVIATFPHDTRAFTEGLLFDRGLLYESTGEYGSSTVREVDPPSGKVLRTMALSPNLFGEGLALVNDRLIQITWREHTAFIYDRETFSQLGQISYAGEGWGLCFDGQWLYMSDGSSAITARDPQSLAVQKSLAVTLDNQPVQMINELECVDDVIYANVWHTDRILRIDKATGRVTGVIDASGLLTADEAARAGREGVLNGIAYNPQHDTFLITGKLWPKLFEVRFVKVND